jgi:long-chain acyl-CoA synthetase
MNGNFFSTEVKLVDVPDMEYSVHDRPNPRGEIWFRGPPVFKGYYKQPDTTKECLTDDGWFATGDIGTWLPDGNLKIIDRKKNLFKLAQGEYLRPEYIQNIYIGSKYIAQMFVYGDSLQNWLVGIVVPDEDAVRAYLRQSNVPMAGKPFQEICQDASIKDLIFKDMEQLAVDAKLNSYEKVKDIYLEPVQWTPEQENAILTPTSKIKRPVAKKRYQQQIDDMYQRVSSRSKTRSKL